MSFLTQVRQVLQQDAREARWALVAFVATLGYAVVQGRQLLDPLPIDESLSVPMGWSTAAAAVAPIVTFLLAGFVALAFAPVVGPTRRANQAWRTLPIEAGAVWSARMLWVLASVALALTVAWLVLLPVPIASVSRLLMATSVALNTAAIMLAGIVLASVTASLHSFLGWMLLTPVLLFLVPLLTLLVPADGSMMSVDIGFARGGLAISTVHVLALLLVTAATLWALLRARRVGWPGRAGAGVVALVLLGANIMRAPAPKQADISETLPTLVAVNVASASLEHASGTITPTPTPDDAGTPAEQAGVRAARRANEGETEETAIHYTLRLDPRLTSLAAKDRLVVRPRSATIRSSGDEWRFAAVASDVIVASGDPLLGETLRWLNAPAPGIPNAYATAVRRPSHVPALTDATASFTLDVARQQPMVLARLPLDGSPATGPWRRFVRAELAAPTDSAHTIGVSLKRLSGTHSASGADDAITGEFTYALLHGERGEAVHLSISSRYGSTVLGWALAPSLLDAVHGVLHPVGTTAVPLGNLVDADWLRGATLVVIGWRTVERGAIAVEAPLRTAVAVR